MVPPPQVTRAAPVPGAESCPGRDTGPCSLYWCRLCNRQAKWQLGPAFTSAGRTLHNVSGRIGKTAGQGDADGRLLAGGPVVYGAGYLGRRHAAGGGRGGTRRGRPGRGHCPPRGSPALDLHRAARAVRTSRASPARPLRARRARRGLGEQHPRMGHARVRRGARRDHDRHRQPGAAGAGADPCPRPVEGERDLPDPRVPRHPYGPAARRGPRRAARAARGRVVRRLGGLHGERLARADPAHGHSA